MGPTQLRAAAIAVLCSLAAGCGDDAPTKAEFLERANAICEDSARELQEAAAPLGDSPSAPEVEEFAVDTAVPNSRRTIAAVRDLGFPEGDEEKLDAMLGRMEDVLDEIEADPVVAVQRGVYTASIEAELDSYGLDGC